MMELFLVVGREGNLRKVQLERFRLDVLRKKCQSKGSLVVQEVTQREPESAHGLVFQGKPSQAGETSVKEQKCWGES